MQGMQKTIVLSSDLASIDDEKIADVRQRLPGWAILSTPTDKELEDHWNQIEIALGGPLPQVLTRAPNLKWLQLGGAGADSAMKALPKNPPLITNASGVHAIPISEHLLGMMLALGRDIHTSVRHQVARTWERGRTVFELAGKRVLLIGLGAIGDRFAASAAGLGMEVVAIRRHPERGAGAAQRVIGITALHSELPHADFVVITTPLTNETQHLIDAAAIDLMKPSAMIFNIGRGQIIDQEALIQALREDRIAGAGLDVFDTEPVPKDSPLWEMENVVMTSHYAGLTPVYHRRLWAIFLDNLDRYLAGKELRNVVDIKLGY
jgi:phosphoglycerate dehydrogenase-like enzyme